MVAAVEELNGARVARHEPPLAIGVGINTGPVVAGVIGKKKFIYDIWGDAVNLAARLEELGEPNRINISEETAEAVKKEFAVTYRGQKEVHNKGLVGMYFVEPDEGRSIEKKGA